MSKSHQIVVATPALPVRPPKRILTIGANEGARQNIAGWKKVFEEVPGEYGELVYADAVYSHADRCMRAAAAAGLQARAMALSTHELHALGFKVDALVVQLDRAQAQLQALEHAVSKRIAVCLFFLLAPPRGLPLGFMVTLTPDELEGPAARDAKLLLRTLGPITSRAGSSSVTGGEVEAELRVSGIRERFREHVSVFKKIAANLTPEVAPILATDGERVSPVVVLPSDKWSTQIELEERILLDRRDLVIEPGSRLTVCETLSGEEPELRLHDLVFRRRDRRLGSRGSRTVTGADFTASPPAPVGSIGAPNAAGRRSDGGVEGALIGLAIVAILLGAASRLQPVQATD